MTTSVRKWSRFFPAIGFAVALMQAGCPPGGTGEITVAPASDEILVGDTLQLEATSTNENDTFTWSSDNPNAATVSATGQVEGVAEGVATITATGTVSGAEDTAVITVSAVENQALVDRYRDLEERVVQVPSDTLDDNERGILLDSLGQARLLIAAGDFCGGAESLQPFLPAVQSARTGASAAALGDLESLYAQGRTLQYETVLKSEQGCAAFPDVNLPAVSEIEESTTERLAAQIEFGAPRLWTVANENGEVFTEVEIPGLLLQSGSPGAPGIPSQKELVAVPIGAEVVADGEVEIRESIQLNPRPYQPQPRDQAGDRPLVDVPDPEFFGDAPFERNENIYDGTAVWPPEPMEVSSLGTFRGLEILQVTLHGGEYNPNTGELLLYDRMNYSIDFEGGEDAFLSASFEHPFESRPSVYTGSVINKDAVVTAPVLEDEVFQVLGEEYIILTHPDFREAADRLAAWKNEKGIVTQVFEGGTNSDIPSRQTAEEIDEFLEDRYNGTAIKASYVLLLGDAEFIPTFYRDFVYGELGTDYPYAVEGLFEDSEADPELAPTFAMGRIPVDTLEQANTVVDKIINYEQNPPVIGSNSAFYTTVSLAAQFQCCRSGTGNMGQTERTYAEVAEFVRPAIRNEGYLAERIYLNTGGQTPRYWYDGTAVPADIGPGSSFTWDGSPQDIFDAYNDGRFLFLHRDHGWVDGWVNPQFTTSDISNELNNGNLLPVVFSVNCSSGFFDNETAGGASGTVASGVYWAEEMLRYEDGGAVGIIGDTRVSPSWPNTALTRGLFDAIWPDTVPGYGGNDSLRRLGDILNHAKLYVGTQVGVERFTEQRHYESELKLYHVFGDPTLEMWTRDPSLVNLIANFNIIEAREDRMTVEYETNGAMVTAVQRFDGVIRPIGRAMVEDGEAEIEYFETPVPGIEIQFAAEMENAVSASGSDTLPQVLQ